MNGPGRSMGFDPKRFGEAGGEDQRRGNRDRAAAGGAGDRIREGVIVRPRIGGKREKVCKRFSVPGHEFFAWVAPSREKARAEGLLDGEEPVFLADEDTIVNLPGGTDEEREAIRTGAMTVSGHVFLTGRASEEEEFPL